MASISGFVRQPIVRSDSVDDRVANAWPTCMNASVVNITVCHCSKSAA